MEARCYVALTVIVVAGGFATSGIAGCRRAQCSADWMRGSPEHPSDTTMRKR